MILAFGLYLLYRAMYAIASPVPFEHSIYIWRMFPPLPELTTMSIAGFVLMWIVFIKFWIVLGWHIMAFKYVYLFIALVWLFFTIEIILRGLTPFGFFFFGSITLFLIGITLFGLYVLIKKSDHKNTTERREIKRES